MTTTESDQEMNLSREQIKRTHDPATVQLRHRLTQLRRINSFLPSEQARPWGLFKLFKSTTDEVRHSFILAYLLDPNNPHGLGQSFLQALMKRLGLDAEPDFSEAEVHTELACGSVIADVVVDLPDAAIIIEDKVWAPESPRQTIDQEKAFRSDARFRDKRLMFVFLTPGGQSAQNPNYIPCSWTEVSSTIANLSLAHLRGLPIQTYLLLTELVEHIEENLSMGNKEWAVIPEKSKLYLEFASDIRQVSAAFEKTVEDIQRGWCDLAEQVMPGGRWESRFPRSKPWAYVQVYKPEWYDGGRFIHFELECSIERLVRREVVLLLDVEKTNPMGAPLPEFCDFFDGDADLRDRLQAIGSNYRGTRRHALARKVYHLADDLSDIAQVLTKSLEEHAFLTDKIDKVLAGLRK